MVSGRHCRPAPLPAHGRAPDTGQRRDPARAAGADLGRGHLRVDALATIAQAKQALERALDGLAANDRFDVIESTSTTARFYRPRTCRPMPPGPSCPAVRAGLEANGGTAMRPALRLALDSAVTESHLRQIVFITDGSVGNEDELHG